MRDIIKSVKRNKDEICPYCKDKLLSSHPKSKTCGSQKCKNKKNNMRYKKWKMNNLERFLVKRRKWYNNNKDKFKEYYLKAKYKKHVKNLSKSKSNI